MEKQEPVILAICESTRVILEPDVLYKFIVVDGCDDCAVYKSA